MTNVVNAIAADIKIAHSVFALPFAVLAACMAASPAGYPINWNTFGGQLLLIIGAMVCARTAAMLANRLLDRELVARNPRTAGRALPSGRLTVRQVIVAWLISAIAFIATCLGFGVFYGNWWPTILGVPVLLWISAYGVMKRFTWLCHVYLGSSLALSPLAAALAISPDALGRQAALWFLAGMVLCWVAGFDVIYALQDVDADRRDGLHSMPSRLGIGRAMWISRLLHAVAGGCLIAAWAVDARFQLVFGLGVFVVITLLVYEHATVSRWGTTKMALAFFTLNGIISCVLGALGVLDVIG
ncbi:MAG: putative 4-hydroxybenzoate polyprenyltransferase [Phycisphaerales bacterium]|nr:putative 4-hydroxybenzoate polyprenyltransferase [Phycisphaerales bacterium]